MSDEEKRVQKRKFIVNVLNENKIDYSLENDKIVLNDL